MRLRSANPGSETASIHLVNADNRSLPCMLCSATNTERFSNMRGLLEHFTNEHFAIHLYGCHLCSQASTSYADFIMHSCFEGKEEFALNEPKFTHCFALLLCGDCGIQFSLNAGVVNEQAVEEYLSLMAVHSSTSMRLVCIYSLGPVKKEQDYFCVPYNSRMSKIDFLCKSDPELQKCCPKLCPRYYRADSVALATFARTTKQFECLELININARIKNVSIDDVLSPVIQTESKIRSAMSGALQSTGMQKSELTNIFNHSLHADENHVSSVDGRLEPKQHVKLYVSSYDTCIPRDILQGFMFEKDIYECGGCYNLFDNLDILNEHYQQCKEDKMVPNTFDPVNPRCARLIFISNMHPSSRVSCGKCNKTSFCSFPGLRLHYARDHSIFINDDHTKLSNKKVLLTYGREVVADELKHPSIVPTKQGPRLSISSIEKMMRSKMEKQSSQSNESSKDSIRKSKRGRRIQRNSNAHLDESMQLEQNQNTDKLKRVSFTRFEHRRRNGSTSLEDVLSSARSTLERSATPSETTRRRANVLEVDSDSHSKRDLRSSNRSLRAHVSKSPPPAPEEHNSSSGSIDAQRKRPPSERAKRMELKKLERRQREDKDIENEEREKEKRRRRRTRLDGEDAEKIAAILSSTVEAISKPPTTNVVQVNEVQVLKPVNGVPAKQPKKQISNDDIEIIDLSDESPNEPNSKNKALDKVVATPPINSEESFLFCCFFCAQDIRNTTDFVQHMARHSEQIQRCPICLVFSRKEQQLKHVLHLIDHIVERHCRMDNNHCVCPHCKKDFGLIQDLEPLYLCFQHVLFMCEKSNYCMLCVGSVRVTRYKNNENKWDHRNEWHTAIYNRFICSKCLAGFPSKFALIEHTCNFTYRCTCNHVQPFSSKQAFIDHVRNSVDKESHSLVKPLSNQIGIYYPSLYRKQLKAMEIEALKQSRLVCPERSECLLFFNKYPHLVVPYRPFSNRFKNLQIIKEPLESNFLYLNQSDYPSLMPKSRKRVVVGEDKTEAPPQKHGKKMKRKQRANSEEQDIKNFKYEKASCERSENIWKFVEEFGDNKIMSEVADLVEDLILTVSDKTCLVANGMVKVPKQCKFAPPRRFPTAEELIAMPALPSHPPVLYKAVQDAQTFHEESFSVDTPPPFLYSIRDKPSDIMASSPQTNSPPLEDEDDEIEVIGEIKTVKPQPPSSATGQQAQRKVIYLQRQPQRVVNADDGTSELLPDRSFSPLLMTRQNRNTTITKSTVPDWLGYQPPYTQ